MKRLFATKSSTHRTGTTTTKAALHAKISRLFGCQRRWLYCRSRWIGGSDVIGKHLDAGRVESIKIFVMPVLLGSGIPTFPRDRSGPGPALELSGSTSFDSGVVRLLYTAK